MLNLGSYGFFDECMEINHNHENLTKIKGKYCMARIPIDKFVNTNNLNKSSIENNEDYTFKYLLFVKFSIKYLKIDFKLLYIQFD